MSKSKEEAKAIAFSSLFSGGLIVGAIWAAMSDRALLAALYGVFGGFLLAMAVALLESE